MGTFHLSSPARKDLTDIKQYTTNKWGYNQSVKYLSEIYSAMQTIADMPAIGKRRTEISEHYFSFTYSSHVIYYINKDDMIVISAVLHKSMVPELHLDKDD